MRIKLKLPDYQVFTTNLIVRVDDINYGNHLSNERALVYAQQARVEWLSSLGLHETHLGKDNIGIIMSDAGIMYQSEAHLGDELKLDLYVDNISKIGFDLYCQITNIATQKAVARIKTGMLIFDYNTKKIATIPSDFLPAIQEML